MENELKDKYESLKNEYQICERKLESKCHALLILSKELDQCRSERDQFKLMGQQIQERYSAVKRRIIGSDTKPFDWNTCSAKNYSIIESQEVVRMLCEAKEAGRCQLFEIEDLKQKLKEAYGDIKLLREQIARQRVGSNDEGLTPRYFPAYEREELIEKLESYSEKLSQDKHDLQQLLDEKEELETERDAYKVKYERLNNELNHILKGDESRIIDIDGLVTEKRFLKERLQQMEEEREITTTTISKYKTLLEKKKTKSILKVGQDHSGGVVLSRKQVRQLLDNNSMTSPSPQAVADLHSLASALLETVNDKNLALNHQRKANKILGNRISDLEKRLKNFEISGAINLKENANYLEWLRAECEEVKACTTVSSEASQGSRNDVVASEGSARVDPCDMKSPSSASIGDNYIANANYLSSLDNLQFPQAVDKVSSFEASSSVNDLEDESLDILDIEDTAADCSSLSLVHFTSDFFKENEVTCLATDDSDVLCVNPSHGDKVIAINNTLDENVHLERVANTDCDGDDDGITAETLLLSPTHRPFSTTNIEV